MTTPRDPRGVYLVPLTEAGREHLRALYGSPRAHLVARFSIEREAVGYARLLQLGNANRGVEYVARIVSEEETRSLTG